MHVGDVILAINGYDIASEEDLHYRTALAKIGETSQFQIVRGGKSQEVAVTPEAPLETPPRDERTLSGHQPLSGVTVANLSPALAAELNMDETTEGVVVLKAQNTGSGVSFNFSLQPGDIILEINKSRIVSVAQLEKLLSHPASSWQILYQRGGNTMSLTIQVQS